MKVLKLLDLFSGMNGWNRPFSHRGHEVFRVDRDHGLHSDLVKDVKDLTPDDVPWAPDAIVASPPCERFSLLAGFRHQNSPLTEEAHENVRATVRLIELFQPEWYLIENPVGLLRKLDLIPYRRHTTTLCQYGRGSKKPTDFWGVPPEGFKFRTPCANGDWCHRRAPRGGASSESYYERIKLPYQLGLMLCLTAEGKARRFGAAP